MLKILSFWLAGELFGIELKYVKEINRNIENTAVPLAPKSIIGLFNMRGQIVTLFNLAEFFEYDVEMKVDNASCIILKEEPGSPNHKGFIIEKSGDVIDVDEAMCEQLPANVNGNERKYIKMVVKLKGNLLRIIEPDILFRE